MKRFNYSINSVKVTLFGVLLLVNSLAHALPGTYS